MGRPKKNQGTPSGYVSKKIQSLSGAVDVITSANPLWDIALKKLSRVSRSYGFSRVETPLMEEYRLFETVLGQKSTSVERIVEILGDKHIAVRSSFLPSVLRAYAQHKIFKTEPMSKWW